MYSCVSHHICLALSATPPHNLFLHISLNRLDPAGFEIVESSSLTDTTNTLAGADDANAGDATELKWEFDKDLGRYYVLFPDDQ